MKATVNRVFVYALSFAFVVTLLTAFTSIEAHAASKKTIKTVTVTLANSNKSYYAVPKITIKNKSCVKGNTTWNVKAKILKNDRTIRDIESKMYVIAKNGYKFTKNSKLVIKGYNKKYTTATVQYLDQTEILVTLKTRSCIKKVKKPTTTSVGPEGLPDDGEINQYINPFAETSDPFYFIYYKGYWYYTNGVAYKTGWVYKYNNYYYFDKKNGKMLVNCTVEIDGKTYTFNDQGVMIKFR